MDTIVLKLNKDCYNTSLDCASKIIKAGGIVAFPTETVYGLGANALNEEAIQKIFKAKGRPSDNPLIVHVGQIKEVYHLTDEVPDNCQKLIEVFWPGPLTMIFKKNNLVPEVVTAGLDTVAVRMPQSKVALDLIKLSGVPIAAPSANISGKPSPTKAEHVLEDLMGRVDAILVGDDCEVGLESTVIDPLANPPVLLRPGGISKEQIEEVIGNIVLDENIEDKEKAPKSPGMKYTHYAPKAPVVVYKGDVNHMIQAICKAKEEKESLGMSVGILSSDETYHFYSGCVISVGSRKEMNSVAKGLFHTLRLFDKEEVDIILAESFETHLMGLAVMNRIIKSAGYNVIQVGGELI